MSREQKLDYRKPVKGEIQNCPAHRQLMNNIKRVNKEWEKREKELAERMKQAQERLLEL